MPPAKLNIASPDLPHDALTESLVEHGYIIIAELAVDLARQAREELAPHIEAAPLGYDSFLGEHTRRVGGILQKSTAARELVMHPTVLALCDRTLLRHAARYQLNFSGVMHLEPGAAAQPLHCDGILYPFANQSVTTLMPTMWALSDFSRENGGTQVVSGSHLWPGDRRPQPGEAVNAEMPTGSVLVYLSGTWHGGGENRGSSPRTGLSFQYSLGWLRQEENQYLANPPEVARDYPEALRRLIGYDYGGPFLGFVDGGDPHRLFEPPCDRPGTRSTPEIDAASEAIERIRCENAPLSPAQLRRSR